MNNIAVQLPFDNLAMEQLAGGHPVTEAAAALQSTILGNVENKELTGLELGSGNGIITLMLALQRPAWQLSGLELQPVLVSLSRRNAVKLGLNCSFREGDLCHYEQILPRNSYDLIYANPPWVRQSSGRISPDAIRALSRQEIACTMSDILDCLQWCLKTDGTAWLVYPNNRRAELEQTLLQTQLVLDTVICPALYPHLFVAGLKLKAA